jgi:hypothetical protein
MLRTARGSSLIFWTTDAMLRSACLINSWRPADLQSAFYNIALNITQPLLDGFRLEGQLELAQGKQFELLKVYCQTILSAFGDVEIALIAIADSLERRSGPPGFLKRSAKPTKSLRIPARTRHARCAGCALRRHPQQEGELHTGRRHPFVLR